jgi:hypothetical protein
MTQGSGTIVNYGAYISNCRLGQKPYKIPVLSLSDVQEYINIGGQPDAALYQLIHTCGPFAGTIEDLTTSNYVIGQKPNDDWYGVFKSFSGVENPLTCFVIGITLSFGALDVIYFSEEYCIESSCDNLTLIKGCYGNLNNKISYDCEGIYFGTHANEDSTPMGDPTVIYEHQLYLRGVEVTLQSIKNTFKQGRTRNFRTEKERIYQFWAELVPEWYMVHVDAVFYRGEVFVGGIKYLVNDTGYEKVEDCKKVWKPTATFKESCYQSFSCEADPCAPPVPTCCDVSSVSATVEFLEGNIITVLFTPCVPTPANGYRLKWRIAGSGDAYTEEGNFFASPIIFTSGAPGGTCFEGYLQSDCGESGGELLGNLVPWQTPCETEESTPNTMQVICTLTPCDVTDVIGFSNSVPYPVHGGDMESGSHGAFAGGNVIVMLSGGVPEFTTITIRINGVDVGANTTAENGLNIVGGIPPFSSTDFVEVEVTTSG